MRAATRTGHRPIHLFSARAVRSGDANPPLIYGLRPQTGDLGAQIARNGDMRPRKRGPPVHRQSPAGARARRSGAPADRILPLRRGGCARPRGARARGLHAVGTITAVCDLFGHSGLPRVNWAGFARSGPSLRAGRGDDPHGFTLDCPKANGTAGLVARGAGGGGRGAGAWLDRIMIRRRRGRAGTRARDAGKPISEGLHVASAITAARDLFGHRSVVRIATRQGQRRDGWAGGGGQCP